MTFDLVVVAASAGGLDALSTVLADLPADFPAPLAVVQHRSTQSPGMLADILSRRTKLRVKAAEAGETPLAGTVYLAPPAFDLLVTPEHAFAVSDLERARGALSSADHLFASAAKVYGERLLAVVLTGTGSDAAAGVRSVGQAGGMVLAQDERSSRAFGMPGAAIATGEVNEVLPLSQIGATLVRLVTT